jgi:hypothetical protein
MGVMNQIQNTKAMKTLPIAQNGVMSGDERKPVICDQSKVRGMRSKPMYVSEVSKRGTCEGTK